MYYTGYEMLWLFLIYSFLGWTVETALAALKKGRLLNRGFLNAPFSTIYGCGWVLFAIFLPELKDSPFYLFLGGAILATGLELLTGILLERLTGQKWWDYSQYRFQFEGHISLPYSVLWGLCALVCLFFSDALLLQLVEMIPQFIGNIILLVVYILLGLDFIASIATVLQFENSLKLPRKAADKLHHITAHLDSALTRAVQGRMKKAYPELTKAVANSAEKKERTRFAEGLCFYKIILLFFITAFLGAVIEIIFCRITADRWMSRSSVLYGQFSIVWGLAAVLLTVILYKYRDRRDGFIFILGTVLGGAYEYACSVFTELVFGTVFWNYSHIPFNLGGRINLLFCFFWGIAAVVWLKYLYPRISGLIERIPKRPGKIITWCLTVFMVFNILLSGLALCRYDERQTMENPPDHFIGRMLDEHFPDSRIKKVYPNLILVK